MELNKIKEALERVDELQVLELLDIRTDQLIERFEDKIKERLKYISKELEIIHEPYEELNFD